MKHISRPRDYLDRRDIEINKAKGYSEAGWVKLVETIQYEKGRDTH